MGERRRSRQFALQILFQVDVVEADLEDSLSQFWNQHRVSEPVREFAERLVRGTIRNLGVIDGHIEDAADQWRLERMAAVDRNLMRLAIYEFLFEPDIPNVVAIDEAIEMAKRYGGDDSGQFVNGILDTVRSKLEAAGSTGAVGAGCRTDPPS